MCLTKMVAKLNKRMKWYDYSLLKLDVLFFTLFLVVVWPWFRNLVFSIAWYWYLALAVILMIPLCMKMCKK
jgi:hypothetical protein